MSCARNMYRMPAKAAGTSMKDFSKACNGPSYSELMDNFISDLRFDLADIISNFYHMPHVIASHLYHVDNLVYLLKNVGRNTLILYVHRDETKRLSSAINEVVTNWCRGGNGHVEVEAPRNFFYKRKQNKCYVEEKKLINVAIKKKEHEIGLGASELLQCEVFEAIKANAPNMVFLDYKYGNNLQKLLAEKYCPNLVDVPVESNVASAKEFEALVKITNSEETVPLNEWLKVKESTLEWALGLHHEATCRAKTRIMEDVLFSCENGFLNTKVKED